MKQIFINLPVENIEAAMNFYIQIGFTVNPLFTFDDQKCMVWSDQIYVILQTKEKFILGNRKKIVNPQKNTIATFTLPVESIERLNEIIEKGKRAGGTAPTETLDEGFMQVRNLEDLDGHIWGIICLDLDKFKIATGR